MEPNSYGFRPGRSCPEASAAIFTASGHKAQYARAADIAKCFDRIDPAALLAQVHPSPSRRRQLKAGLKAGGLDNGQVFPTTAGTRQGGTISPVLANIALHGLETPSGVRVPRRRTPEFKSPQVIRSGDELVVLHADRRIVHRGQALGSAWRKPRGLELKPRKTRIPHTLTVPAGPPGFDFLGFQIRPYPGGKTKSGKEGQGRLQGFKPPITPSKTARQRQVQHLRELIPRQRHGTQAALSTHLNPVSRGWTQYYAHVVSTRLFQKIDHLL